MWLYKPYTATYVVPICAGKVRNSLKISDSCTLCDFTLGRCVVPHLKIMSVQKINVNNQENDIRSLINEFPSLVYQIDNSLFTVKGYINNNGNIVETDYPYFTTDYLDV